jgi:hypothetical protein
MARMPFHSVEGAEEFINQITQDQSPRWVAAKDRSPPPRPPAAVVAKSRFV